MPSLGERSIIAEIRKERVRFNYRLFYDNKDKNFVGIVPDRFVSSIEAMSKSDRDTFKTTHRRKARAYGETEAVIIAASEETVASNMKKLLEKLESSNVKERPVIIIDFENKDGESRSWRRGEFNGVELDYSIGFFTEISGLSSKCVYKQERRDRESYDPGKREIVIDDTPEARAFLEDILNKLKSLGDKLHEFLNDRPRMLEAFNVGDQKLIS
jgi:hypothetical protein